MTFGTLTLCRLAVIAATALATGAIVSTYSRLSHTWDEGTHVAAGLELFQDGRYTYQTENPPLSRLTIALWPWLAGVRLPEVEGRLVQGPFAVSDAIFHRPGEYVSNVSQARVGTLPWFWACIALTWILAGGRRDPVGAALAASAVATMPALVAHAGFATTDVPFVAVFLLAVVALRRFVGRPDFVTAAFFGAALGAAVATKFSTIVFLPPVVMAVLAVHFWSERSKWLRVLKVPTVWRLAATVAVVALLVVWAGYGFRIGRMADLPARFGPYGEFPREGWAARVAQWSVPGHEFLHGLLFLSAHTAAGHRSTLFDEFSQRGFWIYYPVVLATKTPLPFLVLVAGGFAALFRHRSADQWRWVAGLALGALGLLLVATTSPINLGVRHVLALYPLLAIGAAFGWVRWAEPQRRRVPLLSLAAACVVLQAALLAASVPNQITYYNLLAGSDPAYVSSDSDFDWGQDGLALEQYFATHSVAELHLQLNGSLIPCRLHLPPLKPLPLQPMPGWFAVSDRNYRLNRGGRADPCGLTANSLNAPPGWLDWLKVREPVAIIGKTIRLYYVPESEVPPESTAAP